MTGFGKNFLWGAATSAHQVEGGNTNDWTEWEQSQGRRLARSARVRLARQNLFHQLDHFYPRFQSQAESESNYHSGEAAGHYRRFREDFQLAKELGHNAYRFSIEWSRVEPQAGHYDLQAIAHYRDVLNELRRLNIEPVVTLFHFTLPIWAARAGGFLNRDIEKRFGLFVEKMAQEFGDLVTYWTVLNEPTVYASMSYQRGDFPPEHRKTIEYLRVLQVLKRAHRQAFHTIRRSRPQAKIGIAANIIPFRAVGKSWLDRSLASLPDWWWNHFFLQGIAKELDFIGVNHYFQFRLRWGRPVLTSDQYSDLGWGLEPESLYWAVKTVQRYALPILITEHGCADADDSRRGWFIEESLNWLRQAKSEGAPILGYLHWSLLDNYEWDKGFWPRFGLIEVNSATQRRIVRPSAKRYAEYIAKN